MKKLIVILIFCIASMVVVDGLLVWELGGLQEENQNLRNEIFEVKSELAEVKQGMVDKYIQEHTNKVNITDFSPIGFLTSTPGVYLVTVNVTIQNQGINDVSNLIFTVESTNFEQSKKNSTIEVIHAGETINFVAKVTCDHDSKTDIVSTLQTTELLLDQAKIVDPMKIYQEMTS